MGGLIKYLVQVPPVLLALIFGVQGVTWLINPFAAVRFWGFPLPAGGLGLSSMIGALAGWALTIAVCLALGLIRRERVWFYPPMIIFGSMALGRIVAGAFHGAPPLPERFVPELVFVGLLFLAARSVSPPRAA